MKTVLLSWSSGKDCAHALAELRRDPEVEVVGLLTTVNEEFDRVAMHAVRRELLLAQAQAVGLPLTTLPLPYPCSNEEYEVRMRGCLREVVARGITHVAFGDLYLQSVREYREDKLRGTGLEPLFPLWGRPTAQLAQEMLAAGARAVLTCVDPRVLPSHFVGRTWDAALLAALPPNVDPCGENGEFHTFACAGPAFHHPVAVTVTERVERDGFWFADLVPEDGPALPQSA